MLVRNNTGNVITLSEKIKSRARGSYRAIWDVKAEDVCCKHASMIAGEMAVESKKRCPTVLGKAGLHKL